MPRVAISAESRKPPSVTTPATPRAWRRPTRMPPAEAARASLRLSITITAPGRHVAEREGLADHALLQRAERHHVLHHLAAEAALVERGGEGGGGHAFKL